MRKPRKAGKPRGQAAADKRTAPRRAPTKTPITTKITTKTTTKVKPPAKVRPPAKVKSPTKAKTKTPAAAGGSGVGTAVMPRKSDVGGALRGKGERHMYVVGVGASAGGLEALRPLVGHLPQSGDMTCIIAQHLSPQYRSMLVQLVGRETALKVVEVSDGQPLEPDTIYITPPNRDVQVKNSVLRLKEPSSAVGPKPSVDVFFSSLAEDQGQNAIGVILSGTGSDGAHGIRAIKANGGFTIAQTPESAKYDGMPKAAIETGCVDMQLAPEQIGHELSLLVRFPRIKVVESAKSAQGDTFDQIFRLVHKRTDIDFSHYKPATIRRRLERRLAANRIETVEDYLAYVKRTPAELDLLSKDILISVTSFFRDQQAFADLDTVIAELIKSKKPGDTLRIWVPGCATGEEPYSIAMLVRNRLGEAVREYGVQIFATDIDLDAMNHARKGLYSEATVQHLDNGMIVKYFQGLGQSFQIKKPVREMTVFARQDITKDPPFMRVDLISCRNLLIYFDAELQRKVFSTFHYALNPDGYLFLGKSESPAAARELFRTVKGGSKIFKKRMGIQTQLSFISPFKPKVEPEPQSGGVRAREGALESAMRESILDVYAPPSLVINENLDVLHIHGDMNGFLRIPPGKPNLNLGKLITADLKGDLRILMHRVRNHGAASFGTKKEIGTIGGSMAIRLAVHPLRLGSVSEALYLVGFEPADHPAPGLAVDTGSQGADADLRVNELEQELAATREHLQTVIEELETSNEELQALNEELQAANEELQSTNEELETSNEELQSTNEELTTVNEELQVRTNELASANADLENIQTAINVALIVVDKAQRITRFTPAAVRLFGLLPSDLGQIITSVPNNHYVPALRERLAEVIKDGLRVDGAIEAEGRFYHMQIVPYRDGEGTANGAVLTFIDETDLREANHQIQEHVRWLQLITDSVPAMIAYVDRNGRHLFCNKPYADWCGRTRDEISSMSFEAAMGSRAHAGMHKSIERCLAGEAVTFERRHLIAETDKRWLRLTLVPHVGEAGVARGFFALIFDIDKDKQLEASLHQARRRAEEASRAKSDFLANMSHELRTPLNAILGFADIMRNQIHGTMGHAKYLEYADDICFSGGQLLELINDILDLSKIEIGRVVLHEAPIDVAQLVQAVVRMMHDRAKRAGVGVMIDLPVQLPRLFADETAIKRILLNLISNAIKFTLSGGEVRIAALCDGAQYRIVVADTGIGIAKKDIERILLPFEQVDGALARSREGAGLGLPITTSLIKLHGGELLIDSELGRGTQVTVQFPAERMVHDG